MRADGSILFDRHPDEKDILIFCDAVASGADIYLPVQFSNDILYVLKRLYLIKDFGRKGFSSKFLVRILALL